MDRWLMEVVLCPPNMRVIIALNSLVTEILSGIRRNLKQRILTTHYDGEEQGTYLDFYWCPMVEFTMEDYELIEGTYRAKADIIEMYQELGTKYINKKISSFSAHPTILSSYNKTISGEEFQYIEMRMEYIWDNQAYRPTYYVVCGKYEHGWKIVYMLKASE